MANAETILKAIRNFAENPSPSAPRALSLTGKWGVGKTFLWDQAIVTNKDVIQETFTAYSYVSLFGIASLDQLKEKLFTNSQSYTPIDKEPTEDIIKGFWPGRKKKKSEACEDIKKLAQNTNAANLFSKISSHAKMLPMLKSFSSYIGSAEYFLVDNYLICIDDIERRDNSLSMREILGLIDELCTKKSCKVVLIFNQQELSNAEEYNSIREKVIDLEIEYTPSYEACIRVTHEKYDKNLEKLVDCANYLSCDNIRILKKAEWVSSILFETTQTLGYTSLPRKIENEMLVKPLILSSVIFDKFSQHSIKDIKKLLTNYSLSESDSPSKKLAQIARELRSPYGYLDDIIINIFLNGIPCEKSFKQYLTTELANENAQQIYDEIDQAWSFYHDSFEDNCQVFQDTLLEVYKQRKKELTLKNFSSILSGLKITGYDLEEIIKDFL